MTTYLVRREGEPAGSGNPITADDSTEAAKRWAQAANPRGDAFEKVNVVLTNPDGVADRFTIEVEMAPRFRVLRRFR